MRDSRGRGPAPKRLGETLSRFRTDQAPQTPLATVQAIWERIVGERIAAVTEVVEEREGVVTIECSSAVWTQELDLMGPRIAARIKAELGESAPEKLRFRTAA